MTELQPGVFVLWEGQPRGYPWPIKRRYLLGERLSETKWKAYLNGIEEHRIEITGDGWSVEDGVESGNRQRWRRL